MFRDVPGCSGIPCVWMVQVTLEFWCKTIIENSGCYPRVLNSSQLKPSCGSDDMLYSNSFLRKRLLKDFCTNTLWILSWEHAMRYLPLQWYFGILARAKGIFLGGNRHGAADLPNTPATELGRAGRDGGPTKTLEVSNAQHLCWLYWLMVLYLDQVILSGLIGLVTVLVITVITFNHREDRRFWALFNFWLIGDVLIFDPQIALPFCWWLILHVMNLARATWQDGKMCMFRVQTALWQLQSNRLREQYWPCLTVLVWTPLFAVSRPPVPKTPQIDQLVLVSVSWNAKVVERVAVAAANLNFKPCSLSKKMKGLDVISLISAKDYKR